MINIKFYTEQIKKFTPAQIEAVETMSELYDDLLVNSSIFSIDRFSNAYESLQEMSEVLDTHQLCDMLFFIKELKTYLRIPTVWAFIALKTLSPP